MNDYIHKEREFNSETGDSVLYHLSSLLYFFMYVELPQ